LWKSGLQGISEATSEIPRSGGRHPRPANVEAENPERFSYRTLPRRGRPMLRFFNCLDEDTFVVLKHSFTIPARHLSLMRLDAKADPCSPICPYSSVPH
jgi:hypothetical protein